MRRAIQRLIQDPLSMQLLSGDFVEGDTVVVDADAGEARVKFEKLGSRRAAVPGERDRQYGRTAR